MSIAENGIHWDMETTVTDQLARNPRDLISFHEIQAASFPQHRQNLDRAKLWQIKIDNDLKFQLFLNKLI